MLIFPHCSNVNLKDFHCVTALLSANRSRQAARGASTDVKTCWGCWCCFQVIPYLLQASRHRLTHSFNKALTQASLSYCDSLHLPGKGTQGELQIPWIIHHQHLVSHRSSSVHSQRVQIQNRSRAAREHVQPHKLQLLVVLSEWRESRLHEGNVPHL